MDVRVSITVVFPDHRRGIRLRSISCGCFTNAGDLFLCCGRKTAGVPWGAGVGCREEGRGLWVGVYTYNARLGVS